eukprot:1464589-Pleurochrysis_carterae.AAC.1
MALPPKRLPWRSSQLARAGLCRRSHCTASAMPSSANTRRRINTNNTHSTFHVYRDSTSGFVTTDARALRTSAACCRAPH